MKKTVSIMLAALLLVVMGACTSGGAAGDGNTAAGTYKMKSMTIAGQTLDMEALASAGGYNVDDFKVELKDGGEFSMTFLAGEDSQTVSGTWEADGNKISMTVEGETMEATLDGNKLTLSQEGTELTFEK